MLEILCPCVKAQSQVRTADPTLALREVKSAKAENYGAINTSAVDSASSKQAKTEVSRMVINGKKYFFTIPDQEEARKGVAASFFEEVHNYNHYC
ncbi:MAG: hypothetical protein V4700_01610 [Pseudomonadota bacterium]